MWITLSVCLTKDALKWWNYTKHLTEISKTVQYTTKIMYNKVKKNFTLLICSRKKLKTTLQANSETTVKLSNNSSTSLCNTVLLHILVSCSQNRPISSHLYIL